MNAHDELERQLRRSVNVRGQASETSRQRIGPLAVLPIAISLVVVAIVAVALIDRPPETRGSAGPAATQVTSSTAPGPPAGSSFGGADEHAIEVALAVVIRRDPTCSLDPTDTRTNPDVVLLGSPSVDLRRVVPTLGRATGPVHLPARLGAQPFIPYSIYRRYVRRARVVDGTSLWLVPVAGEGHAALSAAGAARCRREETAALAARLPRKEPARSSTQLLGNGEFAMHNDALRRSTVHDGLLLWALRPDGQTELTGLGLGAAEISRRGLVSRIRLGGGAADFAGIAPAAVTKVTLFFDLPGSTRSPLVPISGDVVDDVFVIRVPAALRRRRLLSMHWYNAAGRSIKSIDESSSGI